ncbi:MAG TPA: sensor histidine kinase [Terriglobales bacterium]|nr:sensor histidine kinase [Terriglobales bacterium]
MRYVVPKREHGWVRYIWLAYLGFFFIHPIADHVSLMTWAATLVATAFFLFLYLRIFQWDYPWNFIGTGAMLLLGIVFAPTNYGAATFFIYAASFLPFLLPNEVSALVGIAGIELVILLVAWLFHLPAGFWLPACVFSVLVGGGNIYFAQRDRANQKLRMAHEEIEHLAKVAERERIARDLHDVLGHTLSVIILKSELASKLIDRDPERAKAEIHDVEQTSREALAEVRSTIRGYRQQSVEEEIKRARAALETAGVRVKSESKTVGLTPAQESVVALVIREAVTNVVRHAQAQHCRLSLAPQNGSCVLEIEDDGNGSFQPEGNGLRGMRERIEALGGTLVRNSQAGTRLTIQFPIAHPAEGQKP